MNTFVSGIQEQEARTENNMKARMTTANAAVDLFFKIGASRGKDILPAFTSAYVEDKELALRIALWTRDARAGAGERQLFRNILVTLPEDEAKAVIDRTVELGRWDDLLLEFENEKVRHYAFDKIKVALAAKDGLCAKWMPRKGPKAVELRNYFEWTPKFYRKTLVNATKVVETQMCAKDWDNINFSGVPSLAAARYKKAFYRNTPKFAEYVDALVKKEKVDGKDVYVNAGAVYPYDVLKGMFGWNANFNATEKDHIKEQWNALPNYVGDSKILPLVDVSGSMTCSAGGSKTTTCLEVAVGLGLYLADKNTGEFKDTFLTFSNRPDLVTLRGDIIQKITQMSRSHWTYSTNLHAAMEKVLEVAIQNKVPETDMPDALLILSDMQFNQCTKFDDSAMQMIRRKFTDAGYTVPAIVFWNLRDADNVPVRHDERGVAMVSGFSPAIVSSVLTADMDDMTPQGIMLKTVMNERYNVDV